MAIARITQSSVEILLKTDSISRVSQTTAEILLKTPSDARVSQVAVEIMYDKRISHSTDGVLVGSGADISGLSYIIIPPPLNTISFMFLL